MPAPVVAALLLYTVLAAATFTVARVALEEFAPLALAQLRFLLAGLALAALVAIRRGPAGGFGALLPPRHDRAAVAWLGLLGTSLNQSLFLLGLERTTPAHAALLYALTPILVLALALLRRQERLEPGRALGLLLAFAGVAILLFARGPAAGSGQATLAGDGLILAAVVAWALYTARSRELLTRADPLVVTAAATIFGALVFLPLGVPAVLAQDFAQVSARGWLGLGYVALVTSVVSYLLWSWALSRSPASRVAGFTNLQPVAAALIAWLFLGTPLTLHFAASAAVVLAGVALAERSETGGPAGRPGRRTARPGVG